MHNDSRLNDIHEHGNDSIWLLTGNIIITSSNHLYVSLSLGVCGGGCTITESIDRPIVLLLSKCPTPGKGYNVNTDNNIRRPLLSCTVRCAIAWLSRIENVDSILTLELLQQYYSTAFTFVEAYVTLQVKKTS